jgi:hypothetical protein
VTVGALSESARMSTAREARFRIDHPNSLPRVTRIIALDEKSARVIPSLIRSTSDRTRFLISAVTGGSSPRAGDAASDATLVASDGSNVRLSDELAAADAVVMVASAGEKAEAAAIIGGACRARGILATAVILTSPEGELDASATLMNLRPYAAMLVVTSDEEYLADMLAALRA